MNHIEFIGVGCAGKSTIFKELIDDSTYYGGYFDGGLFRQVQYRKVLRNHTLVNSMQTIVPNKIQKVLFRKITTRRLFNEFIHDNPNFLLALHYALNQVEREPIDDEQISLIGLLKRTAAHYQLGHSTLKQNEILCLDEGFCQRAASIGVRTDSFDVPDDRYFDRIPLPDVLIHVDTSAKRAKERRIKRDGIEYSMQKINNDRQLCDSICNKVTHRGTRVIRVENRKIDLRDIIPKLKNSLAGL